MKRRCNILRNISSNLGLSKNPKQHNKNKFTLGKVIIYTESKSRGQHLTYKVIKRKKGEEKPKVRQTVQRGSVAGNAISLDQIQQFKGETV